MWGIRNPVPHVGGKMICIICTTIVLGICTYTDLKGKYIYNWICGVSALAAILIHIFMKDISIKNMGMGVFIGVIAFIVSILTKERIGKGDAWIVVTIGVMEGGLFLVSVLIWTFLFFNLYAISGMGLKIFNLKSKLPMAPFALVANILVALLSGGKI